MLRLLLPVVATISFFSCISGNTEKPVTIRQPVALPVKDSLENYTVVKQKIIAARDSIRRLYQGATHIKAKEIAAAGEIFFAHAVTEKLIAHWYGTPWDFNGITQQPGQGQIACGYFVSTVLRDGGFAVNRIKLAQLPASEIIKQVTDKNTICSFSLQPVRKVDSVVKIMGPGLYVAGLDFHVGFLFNDGENVYFIHSNYIRRQGVVKENVMQSAAFSNSKYRVIGKIGTANLIKNWLRP